jgi:hypothetical protein
MKALKSRTVWKAIVIALVGIATAVLTEYDLVGYIVILNAVADFALRAVTTVPLSEK